MPSSVPYDLFSEFLLQQLACSWDILGDIEYAMIRDILEVFLDDVHSPDAVQQAQCDKNAWKKRGAHMWWREAV